MIVASQHSIGECSSMCVCLLWARVRARAFFFCIISRTICAHRFNKLLRAHTTTIRPTHWQLYCVLGSSIVFVWSAQMDISFRYYILVESQKFRVFGAKRHRTRTALVYLESEYARRALNLCACSAARRKRTYPLFFSRPLFFHILIDYAKKIEEKKKLKQNRNADRTIAETIYHFPVCAPLCLFDALFLLLSVGCCPLLYGI